jgi:catechol 2,3-dioxygenase-like lactoylglutathione lyase family enzyme
MIGYTLLGTNDMARAKAFYDALFGAIGVGKLWDSPRSVAWGVAFDKPAFGICLPHDEQPASVGNGSMLALVQPSRAQVDTLHARTLELGGKDEGPAGLRGDEGSQAFYGAYVRDLDGNKLCFFRVGPADG